MYIVYIQLYTCTFKIYTCTYMYFVDITQIITWLYRSVDSEFKSSIVLPVILALIIYIYTCTVYMYSIDQVQGIRQTQVLTYVNTLLPPSNLCINMYIHVFASLYLSTHLPCVWICRQAESEIQWKWPKHKVKNKVICFSV